MTLWCARASSWCFLLSKRCTILPRKSDPPHMQPAFLRTEGRRYRRIVVLVSLGWSTCRRKAGGRFQRRRGGCRLNRPLPIVLMQKLVKDHTKRIKTSLTSNDKENYFFTSRIPPLTSALIQTKLIKDQASKDEESICSLVSWHRLETKKRHRKTKARARMIVKLN